MSTLLDEVPGAQERPGGCRIEVLEAPDGSVTISIPPRPANIVSVFASLLLTANLLLVLYTGGRAILFHQSVLLMAQISPNDLPFSLRGYALWLLLALLILEAVGFLTLAIILRPLLLRETLWIGSSEIEQRKAVPWRVERWRVPRSEVRGFHWKRDPLGFAAGLLTLQTRSEEKLIAESVPEAEREWLASVGNALLYR